MPLLFVIESAFFLFFVIYLRASFWTIYKISFQIFLFYRINILLYLLFLRLMVISLRFLDLFYRKYLIKGNLIVNTLTKIFGWEVYFQMLLRKCHFKPFSNEENYTIPFVHVFLYMCSFVYTFQFLLFFNVSNFADNSV